MIARAEALRTGVRESVAIPGTYQVGERPAEPVLVTDLSAYGCRLRGDSVGVTKSEPVMLWLGETGPIGAKLKWVKKGSLGLAFDDALDDNLLERLLATPFAPAPSNVVPLKRRFEV
jgi:hypothetical protein